MTAADCQIGNQSLCLRFNNLSISLYVFPLAARILREFIQSEMFWGEGV